MSRLYTGAPRYAVKEKPVVRNSQIGEKGSRVRRAVPVYRVRRTRRVTASSGKRYRLIYVYIV